MKRGGKMIELKEKEIETIERKGFGYNPISYGEDLDEEVEEIERQFKRNKAVVKEILETYDKATNNDMILYFEALRTLFDDIIVTNSHEYIIFKFPRKDIKYFPSPESISRSRRILNQAGIGLPTNPHVFLRRMRRQKAIRQYFKENKE